MRMAGSRQVSHPPKNKVNLGVETKGSLACLTKTLITTR